MLVANGFDGVNIDFEGMPPSTKAGVTAFMRELSAKLRSAGLLVTMAVPARKILLGLAGYGYDWSASGGITEVNAARAPALAARYGAPIVWDNTAQAPHFTYWRSGTRHDVWYENSYSIFKIAQVRRYNLGGVALWALGMEDARFRKVIGGTTGWSGGL